MDDVLKEIVAAAKSLTNSSFAAIRLSDSANTNEIESVVTSDSTNSVDALFSGSPEAEGLLHAVIADTSPIISNRVTGLKDPQSVCMSPKPDRFLGVPIILQDRRFGAIYVCDKLNNELYDEQDAEVLKALAAAAAAAIHNLNLRQTLSAIELRNDRARIARDLHDDVIQRLFAVGLNLQSSLRMIGSQDARDQIAQAIDYLDQTIQGIRTTIFDLEHSGDHTTRSSLIALTKEIVKPAGIDSEVRFSGPIDSVIGPKLKDYLLKAAREMLTNAVKHSGASHILLTLDVRENVRLAVVDNGAGIEVLDAPRGHGLRNLAQRASVLGGNFQVARLPQGGTEAIFEIPAP